MEGNADGRGWTRVNAGTYASAEERQGTYLEEAFRGIERALDNSLNVVKRLPYRLIDKIS